MKVNTNIRFTPAEQEVIAIIKEVIDKYTPSTEAYIVGGLIRDRLVGLPSHDMDIMVYPTKAEDFAKLITKHLSIKDPHVIKENPDKSKFVSTSKVYLPTQYGVQEIDIAQARKDVYRGDSRIPETTPATPQEDAMRRDLTVNSIMFDIKNNKIVDFTGKGINDLISNTIRTPLDPLKTFSDDPLRIFRVIVYASKLNGNIDPQTYQAMLDPSLRNEIKQKVSKERIGQEVIKALNTKNPEVALKLLKDTGLWQDIIEESLKGTKYEGKMAELDLNQQNAHHLLTVWGHSMQVVSNVLKMYPDAEPEKRVTIILAALMHDIGKLYKDIWGESKSHPGSRSYHGHEEESKEIATLILKYLKIEPYIQQVSSLTQYHMRPHRFTEGGGEGSARSLRRFIRECGEQSLNWLDVFNLATADAYSKGLEIDPNTIQQYKNLELRLQEALASLKPVDNKSLIKPVLDGNEIMQILNIKAGPQMKEITNYIKELKDENPDISKEEAANKLREKYLNIRQASSKDSKMATLCPMTIVKAKIDEINNLLDSQKHYEIFTILNELMNEYGNDENIVRLLASSVFKLLLKSEEFRCTELLQHVMDKAESNFFDPTLCCYVVGILLLLETETKDETIEEIAGRMSAMSPELLTKILKQLPKNCHRSALKDKIQRELGLN